MFEVGKIYKRKDELHSKYGGQERGGISTPAAHPIVFLFTGETGEEYGYRDHWEGSTFYYTGEGQEGDMTYTNGNRAIGEHVKKGETLHLFEIVKQGVRYVGQLEYVNHSFQNGRDKNGKERKIIVFQLELVK